MSTQLTVPVATNNHIGHLEVSRCDRCLEATGRWLFCIKLTGMDGHSSKAHPGQEVSATRVMAVYDSAEDKLQCPLCKHFHPEIYLRSHKCKVLLARAALARASASSSQPPAAQPPAVHPLPPPSLVVRSAPPVENQGASEDDSSVPPPPPEPPLMLISNQMPVRQVTPTPSAATTPATNPQKKQRRMSAMEVDARRWKLLDPVGLALANLSEAPVSEFQFLHKDGIHNVGHLIRVGQDFVRYEYAEQLNTALKRAAIAALFSRFEEEEN